ncbi:MAG: Zn-ribbon containing protein [Haloarculaceae archaeon]
MPHQCTNCGRTFADGSKAMLSGCPDCSGTKFQFRPDGFDDAGPDDAAPGGAGTDGTGPDDASSPGGSVTPVDSGPKDSMGHRVGSAAATVRDLVSGDAGAGATTATPRSDAAANGSDDDIIVAEPDPAETGVEDSAQADARSRVAEPDELPNTGGSDTGSPPGSADPAPADGADGGSDSWHESDTSAGSGAGYEPAEESEPEPAQEPGPETEGQPAADPGDEGPETESGSDRAVVEEPDVERPDRPDLAELREELNEQFESIRVVEPGQYELNLMELYDREEYIIALQEDGRYSIQVPETWREDV